MSQQEPRIAQWWRSPDTTTWQQSEVTAGELPIPCQETSLEIEAIYSRVFD